MTAPSLPNIHPIRTGQRRRALLGFVLVLVGVAALEEDGLDTRGAGFQKSVVTLTKGGN